MEVTHPTGRIEVDSTPKNAKQNHIYQYTATAQIQRSDVLNIPFPIAFEHNTHMEKLEIESHSQKWQIQLVGTIPCDTQL